MQNEGTIPRLLYDLVNIEVLQKANCFLYRMWRLVENRTVHGEEYGGERCLCMLVLMAALMTVTAL